MLKNIPTMVVFHITPLDNLHSIKLNGINPACARSNFKVAWYCSKRHIEWAVIHCSVRHHVYPDELMVLAVLADGKDLVPFFQPGRYHSGVVMHPESYTPALFFIQSIGQGDQDYDGQ